MFSKLRMKFTAILTASVAIVLAIVFSAICVADYQRSENDVHQALSSALDRTIAPPADAQLQHGGMGRRHSADDGFGGPRIGGMGDPATMIPVAIYLLDGDGSYSAQSEFASATIDSEVADSAVKRVESLPDGSGLLDDLGLHYEKRDTEQGVYVAFADISNTSGWRQLALSLAVAGLGVVIAFAAIGYFLSNRALKPVKEAWESQRQFVADASHELKTPLTVILANNSILLKHPEDTIASQSQWIESSQVEAENMQGLVNEMLELAQVESRAAVAHERLDFSDLVDGIALQFESVAFERGCELSATVQEGLFVDGDQTRLRKAVSTLVENALKYVDAGGEVGVALAQSGKKAQLSISNTGSYISPEDLPHIFDRFYRTDKARTSGAGGYGLGLAIAREIAREHGGDIACSSDAASGTVFTMTVPTC